MYGSYGVAHGIVSSFPLRSKGDGGYEIVQGVYELLRQFTDAVPTGFEPQYRTLAGIVIEGIEDPANIADGVA